MADNYGAGEAPNRSDCSESYESYLKRAVDACEAGDLVLGMHLYLAAYEKAVIDPAIPDGMALAGLREAWSLACELKERSLAEYVFEKLEPFLTGEEIAACAQRLQSMALDRLEQYGFSREELEGMAEMISQDFVGDGSVVKVESISIPGTTVVGVAGKAQLDASEVGAEASAQTTPDQEDAQESAAGDAVEDRGREEVSQTVQSFSAADESDGQGELESSQQMPEKPAKPNQVNMGTAPIDDFNPYDIYRDYSVGKSYHCATNEGSGAHVFTLDKDREKAASQIRENQDERIQASEEPYVKQEHADEETPEIPLDEAGQAPVESVSDGNSEQKELAAAPAQTAVAEASARQDVFDYRSVVGYDEAVSIMRDYGIGLQNDRAFMSVVETLNERHGLDRAPALDTMLVRAAVLEDATRFVDATIGEIGLPALRMSMEEGAQGFPMLCISTYGNSRPRMNHAHNRFESPAILVIDDLDTWVMPSMPENAEGMAGFVMANISRGAREAMNMIRAAVEDPDVVVLVTATATGDPDPFFYEILEPLTVVDIGLPNDKERMDIWTEIAQNHPSMRSINRADLMRYSDGLSRYDIYMAAREAIEEAYKSGLLKRSYVPVSPQNIFEKIAAFQPLESEEYHALEEEVVRSFRDDLAKLEDLVNGSHD